jgi:hypothetical protein
MTAPSVLKKSPFSVTFDRPVMGVSASNFTVQWTFNGSQLAGTLACLDASNASVSCAAGPVTTAQLTPSGSLLAGG